MKQKDIALIIVVIFISAMASFFLSRIFITSPKNRSTKVEVVEPITADFPQPDTHVFNADANDPTKLIRVGDTENKQPFNGRSDDQ